MNAPEPHVPFSDPKSHDLVDHPGELRVLCPHVREREERTQLRMALEQQLVERTGDLLAAVGDRVPALGQQSHLLGSHRAPIPD